MTNEVCQLQYLAYGVEFERTLEPGRRYVRVEGYGRGWPHLFPVLKSIGVARWLQCELPREEYVRAVMPEPEGDEDIREVQEAFSRLMQRAIRMRRIVNL